MFSNSQDKVIAVGLTAKELVDLLSTNKACDAQRALNYFDGQQEEEMIRILNDGNYGRTDWKGRGINPRYRNVTRMVVEKSGMLFKDTMPVMEVFNNAANSVNEAATQGLAQGLASIEFPEFLTNFDQIVRLLKTAMILVQWDAEQGKWMLDILHRGNSEVITDPATRKKIALVFRSHENCFWVWTNEQVVELRTVGEGASAKVTVVQTTPNAYGMIPVAEFYDTNTPRTGYWVEQDKSLVNFNEMLNLHILDSEYSILWNKMSTVVTNMVPAGDGNIENYEYSVEAGSTLPRRQVSKRSMLGGPNQVITMDSTGVDGAFFEYKNPKIDLKPLNEVMESWLKGYAADWSVSIRSQGEGRAESGFQLIVEEMDNLDLRKQRQRMFENGFKRLYRVLGRVYNTASSTNTFPADSDLFVTFNDPVLPIDIQTEETVWSQRIKEGRATPIDYFMHVWGMNREEALLKFLEIKEFNQQQGIRLAQEPTAPTPIEEQKQPSDRDDK